MARTELHSDTLKVDQHPPIMDPSSYDGDIVLTERIESSDYADALAFMEEPCRIRIEPGNDKNAPGAYPIWVNGKGAEILHNGRWLEITYLPVGLEITIRRKVLEVIIRAKTDAIHTKVQEMDSERPNNVIQRFTSGVFAYSVLEDSNPRGAEWVSEIRRRNL